MMQINKLDELAEGFLAMKEYQEMTMGEIKKDMADLKSILKAIMRDKCSIGDSAEDALPIALPHNEHLFQSKGLGSNSSAEVLANDKGK